MNKIYFAPKAELVAVMEEGNLLAGASNQDKVDTSVTVEDLTKDGKNTDDLDWN